MHQLTIFDIETERSQPSVTSSVTDAKRQIIQDFCNRAAIKPLIETYAPPRRKSEYYRVTWRDGNKVKHLHIPGGNTLSILAQYRAGKLQEMIDRGAELGEIIAAVKTYRG
jgi:hypothetical protein